MSRDPMGVAPLVKFIKEREAIRVKKQAGKKRPWTKDPILGKYRFCNVHREDDRVTQWLRANYYYHHLCNDPDVWFAAIVARLFNQPEALYEIMPYVLPWKPEKVRQILHNRKKQGLRNFNAAYIVSTNGVAMDKIDYIVHRVLSPIWASRKRMRPKPEDTLETYHTLLTEFDGLGSFIAAQIVADLKYINKCPLRNAEDWWTFAASGPGSRRGLNRWRGYSPDSPYKEWEWRKDLCGILEAVNEELAKVGWEPLHAQDLQNCLCEFDKYERARLGEGEPKQLYKEKE